MKDRNHSTPIVNIGTSSLLIIFVILCLVVFAALALSSAKSDLQFSEDLAQRKTAYYEASYRAEEIAGEIDSLLAQGKSPEECSAEVKVSGSSAEYEVIIDDSRKLVVSLRITGRTFEIQKWQTVALKEWEGNDTLNLIKID